MVDATTDERWLPIPGYEGFYEVSDHGRVRSLARVVLRSDGVLQPYKGRVLSPGRKKLTEHLFVILCGADKRHRNQQVHRLVLFAFVGPAPPGMVCCHWDDDPTNNHLGNLRWDTRRENVKDAIRNGINHYTSLTHCPRGHPYQTPNLVESELKRGGRKCLACGRATNLVQCRVRAGLVEAGQVDMQALSDLLYDEVIATNGLPRVRVRGLSYPQVLPLVA